MKRILVSIGKTEARVVKARHHIPFARKRTRRLRRNRRHLGIHAVHNGRLELQHLARTIKTCLGARHGHHHHLRRHDVEEDEDGILQHCRNAGNLHSMRTHTIAAKPDNAHLNHVHHEETRAIETRKHVVHADGVLRILPEHAPFALLLALLPTKRSNHARTDDVLA